MAEPKLKRVLVQWRDSAASTATWEMRDDLDMLQPVACTSIGFVVEDIKDHLTLVATISEHQVQGRMTIPREAILTVKPLRIGE